MDIKEVAISGITPYAKNAKKHDKKQVHNIAESIKQYGWTQPLVLDKNNVIVIGHGRYYAAKELRLKEVPCVYMDSLTPEQIKALRIADNKLNESPWDLSLLAEEIEGLDFGNMELDFSELETEPTKVREDDYNPEPPKEPKSLYGDVYQLGRHRLMCGDSTILSDVQKLMGGAEADMLLTDPPYNVALGTGGVYQTDEGRMGNHEFKENGAFLLNDDLPDDEFRQFLTDAFSNAVMVMKKGAAFHIWHADTQRVAFEAACRNAGLSVRQCLIWVKDHFTLSRQDFQWQHEPVLTGEIILPPGETELGDEHESSLYGWVEGSGHYWFKHRKETTVLYFDRPKASKEHPTMKPVLLFDYEMKCNTLTGENVLDLFGGSGTTIIAAEQNGRNAFVMEYDPKFCDVIIDRYEAFTGDKAVLLSRVDNYVDQA